MILVFLSPYKGMLGGTTVEQQDKMLKVMSSGM
jgi:hypothetical protein